jgi:hypothetical protein
MLREENAGGVAQLGERLNGIQEVRGSIPLTSIPEPDASIIMAGLAKKGPAELSVTGRFGGRLLSVRLRELVKGFSLGFAGIAQLVEHNLAKVGVAGSSPVSRF